MRRLTEAGIVVQRSAGKRNRVFEAVEIIDAIARLERRLASPVGDTAKSIRSRSEDPGGC